MEALALSLAVLLIAVVQVSQSNDLSKLKKRIEDLERHVAKILEKLK